MTIRSFELFQPRSLAEACELLVKHGDDARAIGGGTTLVILDEAAGGDYPFLVDLQSIPGLNISRKRTAACALAPSPRIVTWNARR